MGRKRAFIWTYCSLYFPQYLVSRDLPEGFREKSSGLVSTRSGLWHFSGSGRLRVFWIPASGVGLIWPLSFAFFGRPWNAPECNTPCRPHQKIPPPSSFAPLCITNSQERGAIVKNRRGGADSSRRQKSIGRGRGEMDNPPGRSSSRMPSKERRREWESLA